MMNGANRVPIGPKFEVLRIPTPGIGSGEYCSLENGRRAAQQQSNREEPPAEFSNLLPRDSEIG
jgi:hypothetical protein